MIFSNYLKNLFRYYEHLFVNFFPKLFESFANSILNPKNAVKIELHLNTNL
jgi:hypothetical protein